jgi:hypothetical protein
VSHHDGLVTAREIDRPSVVGASYALRSVATSAAWTPYGLVVGSEAEVAILAPPVCAP